MGGVQESCLASIQVCVIEVELIEGRTGEDGVVEMGTLVAGHTTQVRAFQVHPAEVRAFSTFRPDRCSICRYIGGLVRRLHIPRYWPRQLVRVSTVYIFPAGLTHARVRRGCAARCERSPGAKVYNSTAGRQAYRGAVRCAGGRFRVTLE